MLDVSYPGRPKEYRVVAANSQDVEKSLNQRVRMKPFQVLPKYIYPLCFFFLVFACGRVLRTL